MKIHDFDISFCLNAFPFKNYDALKTVLFSTVPEIRKELCSDCDFAVGLWLPSKILDCFAADSTTAAFSEELKKHGLYVFSLNAFPYGEFHSGRIKEKVYKPDWRESERVKFTVDSAEFLSKILPLQSSGSISTVPGRYRYEKSDNDNLIFENIIDTGEKLKEIHRRSGRKIGLAIEMEPDCLWENTDEIIEFYKKISKKNPSAAEYIGVCYDTCHQEIVESTSLPGTGIRKLIEADVPIFKIQLSAAMEVSLEHSQKITKFADSSYFHQTILKEGRGELSRFRDLSDALAGAELEGKTGTLVSHFHMPVFMDTFPEFNFLKIKKDELSAVLEILRENPNICSQLEIETYTYNMLKNKLNDISVSKSIVKEYEYIKNIIIK